jgi:hypothetical protein
VKPEADDLVGLDGEAGQIDEDWKHRPTFRRG